MVSSASCTLFRIFINFRSNFWYLTNSFIISSKCFLLINMLYILAICSFSPSKVWSWIFILYRTSAAMFFLPGMYSQVIWYSYSPRIHLVSLPWLSLHCFRNDMDLWSLLPDCYWVSKYIRSEFVVCEYYTEQLFLRNIMVAFAAVQYPAAKLMTM